jgi:hypothetical protein
MSEELKIPVISEDERILSAIVGKRINTSQRLIKEELRRRLEN